MGDSRTLGDILGEALASSDVTAMDHGPEAVVTFDYIEPPPIVRTVRVAPPPATVAVKKGDPHIQGEFATYPWPIVKDGVVVDTIEVSALDWGRLMSALHAAQEIAEYLAVPVADVRGAFQRMSPNLNCLLDSPHGWAVLSMVVAAILGVSDNGELYLATMQ